MTPLPKRRHSTRRGGKRKAAISLTLLGLAACPHCRSMRVPHRVCPKCGYYNGKEVIKHENRKRPQTSKTH